MRKISAYFISIILVITGLQTQAQDTIPVIYKIRAAADLFGPGYYFSDRNNLTIEGFVSVDIDTNKAVVLEAGYQDFRYSQYNYDYLCNGIFFRGGVNFNLLSPGVALGQYYAGIGLKYGLSIFTHEVPWLKSDNYWGTEESSFKSSSHAAHFVEVSPGINTELFRNFSIGFIVRLRVLIYAGSSGGFEPVNIPGYGNGTKRFSPGLSYYMIWSIPYRK